jgi:hypothetical protein
LANVVLVIIQRSQFEIAGRVSRRWIFILLRFVLEASSWLNGQNTVSSEPILFALASLN